MKQVQELMPRMDKTVNGTPRLPTISAVQSSGCTSSSASSARVSPDDIALGAFALRGLAAIYVNAFQRALSDDDTIAVWAMALKKDGIGREGVRKGLMALSSDAKASRMNGVPSLPQFLAYCRAACPPPPRPALEPPKPAVAPMCREEAMAKMRAMLRDC